MAQASWQYFNYKKEDKRQLHLKISPHSWREECHLRQAYKDFVGGKIFKELPLIPPEWKEEFDLKVILKEEPIHIIPEDVLFLTNIQQLEERKNKKEEIKEYRRGFGARRSKKR